MKCADELEFAERPCAGLGLGDALGEERPLGALTARGDLRHRRPCAGAASPAVDRPPPRARRALLSARVRSARLSGSCNRSETTRVSSIRSALGASVANTGRSSSSIRSLPSGLP